MTFTLLALLLQTAPIATPSNVTPLQGMAYGSLGAPATPVDPTHPLPTLSLGRQETLQLASGNTAAAPVSAYGGGYVFAQLCSSYGSVALQVLGPDGTTWATVLTRSAADTNGGSAVQLGSGATVRVVLTGTAGCAASLSRVPA